MDIARTPIAGFLASVPGRVLRIVAGILLVWWGYTLLNSVFGIALIVVGLVPLSAGIFDFCVVSALLGGPFWGATIRSDGSRR